MPALMGSNTPQLTNHLKRPSYKHFMYYLVISNSHFLRLNVNEATLPTKRSLFVLMPYAGRQQVFSHVGMFSECDQ